MGEFARNKGIKGESVAVAHLEKRQYLIIQTNFRWRGGEIDIIAEDPDGVLVGVEVKTFQRGSMVHPLEAVNASKIGRIRRTMECFLMRFPTYSKSYIRFDVILASESVVVEHLENVF
ncbi:YraN family protein [bacterium]|nr:YraN family protein [bacterium]